MMKTRLPKCVIERIVKDKWLQNMYQKMKEATDKNELNKFLDENPDYFQVIMYLASQVEIID